MISLRQHVTKVCLCADDHVLCQQMALEQNVTSSKKTYKTLKTESTHHEVLFNASKCNPMNITKNRNKIQHENSLHSKILKRCLSTTNSWVYTQIRLHLGLCRLMTPSLRWTFAVMYNHTFFVNLQITQSDIRPHNSKVGCRPGDCIS